LIETLRDHRPPASAIVEQTVETIWKLAEGGYVILVGRAANVITARLRNVFHVRLISPLEGRLERVEEVYDLDRRNALDYLKSQDIARRLYLKEYFGHDIEDPLIYHLVVNTNHFSYDEAAKLIGDAVIRWFNPPRETQSK
jgi:cytidylate kinase